MATVGTYNFPVEDRLDGEFVAWVSESFDEGGAYIDAPDASVLWYFVAAVRSESAKPVMALPRFWQSVFSTGATRWQAAPEGK